MSAVLSVAMKWFLNVRIARSAALVRCIPGAASSIVIVSFLQIARKSLLHSLSMRSIVGLSLPTEKISIPLSKQLTMSAADRLAGVSM